MKLAVALLTLYVLSAAAGAPRKFSRVHHPDPVDDEGHGLHRQLAGATVRTYLHREKGHAGRDVESWKEYHERREKLAFERRQKELEKLQPSTYLLRHGKGKDGEVKEPTFTEEELREIKSGLWPHSLDSGRHLSEEDRKKLREELIRAEDPAKVFKKYNLNEPHAASDAGKCYSAAAKLCKGMTYSHAEFIHCAVGKRADFVGEDEHCQIDFAKLWEPCAADLINHCPRMASDKTMSCLLASQKKISEGCRSSEIFHVMSVSSENDEL